MTASKPENEREKRLKAALRDNLKRRKQAARKPREEVKGASGDGDAEDKA